VAFPSQQVQAAAVTWLHTDVPIGTQYLTWRTVAAGLAVPHAVLGGKEGRALVSRKQGLRDGQRVTGRSGRMAMKEAEEGGGGKEDPSLQLRGYFKQFMP
jgi:hypothetical protein